MKKTFFKLIPALLTLLIIACGPPQKSEKIPVSTSSDEALQLYNKAIEAGEKVYIGKALELYEKASVTDPDFFMANYQIALYQLYFKNDENFKKYANKAIAVNVKLSDGEELLKQALQRFLENRKSDVTDLGEELIKLYPKDDYAYYYQSFFYILNDNNEQAIEYLKKGIEHTNNAAPYYNTMGYAYLGEENMDAAKEAFDKYIELEPEEPNPYDSKGDYFMAMKDYQAAHDNFMKAYTIDTNFKASLTKAKKAKMILDSLGNE